MVGNVARDSRLQEWTIRSDVQRLSDQIHGEAMTADRDRMLLEFVREAFNYQDGRLLWRERPAHHFTDGRLWRSFNARYAGTVAGTVNKGYLIVNSPKFGKLAVHRIVFLMHHGYLPTEIDHADGDKLNNRIDNLRVATRWQNMKNVKTYTTNTSGRKGVYWHKTIRKWNAGIRIDGKQKSLGMFDLMEQAIAARVAAERQHYGEFANDR